MSKNKLYVITVNYDEDDYDHTLAKYQYVRAELNGWKDDPIYEWLEKFNMTASMETYTSTDRNTLYQALAVVGMSMPPSQSLLLAKDEDYQSWNKMYPVKGPVKRDASPARQPVVQDRLGQQR